MGLKAEFYAIEERAHKKRPRFSGAFFLILF